MDENIFNENARKPCWKEDCCGATVRSVTGAPNHLR